MKKIIVLGSINMDLVVQTDRAPQGGETLSGTSFQTIPGGKGANQAVAIARQGGEISMIGRVGSDGFGKELLKKLEENKVNVGFIKEDDSCSTGVAMIVVEKSGQNRIIVVAGANGEVFNDDIDSAETLFDDCGYLVAQLETPLPTVAYAINKAKSKNIKTVLNAAPAPEKPLDNELLKKIDYLLVNETEAQMISGEIVDSMESALNAAKVLNKQTQGCIILTLGDKGSVTADGNSVWHTPSFKINAVDTTAAGDAFTGGLVNSLNQGLPLKEAVLHATAAGALAASKFGAQPSLPTFEETKKFLASR